MSHRCQQFVSSSRALATCSQLFTLITNTALTCPSCLLVSWKRSAILPDIPAARWAEWKRQDYTHPGLLSTIAGQPVISHLPFRRQQPPTTPEEERKVPSLFKYNGTFQSSHISKLKLPLCALPTDYFNKNFRRPTSTRTFQIILRGGSPAPGTKEEEWRMPTHSSPVLFLGGLDMHVSTHLEKTVTQNWRKLQKMSLPKIK